MWAGYHTGNGFIFFLCVYGFLPGFHNVPFLTEEVLLQFFPPSLHVIECHWVIVSVNRTSSLE